MKLSALLDEARGTSVVLVGRTSLEGRRAFEQLVRQAGERAMQVRLAAGSEQLVLDDETRVDLIRTHADHMRGRSVDLVAIDTETYDLVGLAIENEARLALRPGGRVVPVDFSG